MTTETVVELPVESLLPSEHNQRLQLRGLEELAESIKQHGVLEPLLVTANGNNSHHLVAGHRRLAAAKMAGRKTVPCIVRAYPEEQGLLMAMLVDNLQRDDLSPLEEAHGYQQLADMHNSQRDIARLVGRSQPHVNKRLGILKLSPGALTQFEAGKVMVDEVALLAALPAERPDRLFKETGQWGSISQRISELEWKETQAKRREEEAKRPKPKVTTGPSKAQREATQKVKEQRSKEQRSKEQQLAAEAKAARAKVLPRLFSRGERELQYAGAVLAELLDFAGYGADDPVAQAFELLKLKAKKGRQVDQLREHAGRSKKAAVDVLVAAAIALGECEVGSPSGNPVARLHIERLQKVGYQPNASDRALLKVRAR